MSKAIICDRCGKAIKEPKGISKLEVYNYISFTSVNASEVITKDICKECLDKIMLLIDSKEELQDRDKINHDGCNGCIHANLKSSDYPCTICKQNYKDKYEGVK